MHVGDLLAIESIAGHNRKASPGISGDRFSLP